MSKIGRPLRWNIVTGRDRGPLRNDKVVGPIQQVLQPGYEQIGDVWDGSQHESLVATVNLLQADMWIVDPPFADQVCAQILRQARSAERKTGLETMPMRYSTSYPGTWYS